MTAALKTVCFVTALFGITTAVICIWFMADQVKIADLINWDGGDSAKIGIVASILMISIGIAIIVINIEKHFNLFAGALLVIFALLIAFLSISAKNYQDFKQLQTITDAYVATKYGVSHEIIMNSRMRHKDDFLNTILIRLKLMNAFGGIDTCVLIIGIIIFYRNDPRYSSQNAVFEEERKF